MFLIIINHGKINSYLHYMHRELNQKVIKRELFQVQVIMIIMPSLETFHAATEMRMTWVILFFLLPLASVLFQLRSPQAWVQTKAVYKIKKSMALFKLRGPSNHVYTAAEWRVLHAQHFWKLSATQFFAYIAFFEKMNGGINMFSFSYRFLIGLYLS